ncbi:hypothetical protein GCM10010156_64890 [Planobispora rosea]|uniref:Uncharacterized protein n=1 Tax=Planobispora rosea TaxID=35762 RepID=A0A8J3S4R3_PLARO|nr:hypothetical protein [Planobispora rosea]GGS97714.1 hypothetical protein GCM10010156_64890 [Planobispora rosea]GIH87832.1 hypothetical protein Pro02_62400 [Planobispora rosea]
MSYLTQAEVLADTDDLAVVAAAHAGRCTRAGLDVRSYAGLIGAAVTLGRQPHRMCVGWASDHALICALVELEIALRQRDQQIIDAIAVIQATCRDAECHLDDENEKVVAWAYATIADCQAALEVLAPVPYRLQHALARLITVPVTLGETYAAIYALIARGRLMPYAGRWITGST